MAYRASSAAARPVLPPALHSSLPRSAQGSLQPGRSLPDAPESRGYSFLTRGEEAWTTSEELTPRSPGISRLRGYGFLDFDKLISSGLSLSFQFGFESLLPPGIFLCPDGSVVLDLLLHHRVEDDRDFVSRCGLRCRRADLALHPAQVVSHRAEFVMQTESRHAE